MVIAPATAADFDAIVALLERNGLPIEGLAGHLSTALVAREAETIVGVAAVELYADGALLRSVAVDPAVQTRGVGAALTGAALTLAEARGAREVFLLTTTAEGDFPRFGFKPTSRAAVPRSLRSSVEFTTAPVPSPGGPWSDSSNHSATKRTLVSALLRGTGPPRHEKRTTTPAAAPSARTASSAGRS